MKFKYIKNIAFAGFSAAILSACGGGTCAPEKVSNLSLKIEAPSQYPAGLPVPVKATLTMTNTSNTNASNLIYTVPAPGESGNNTGVVITPDANGLGNHCENIAAHNSCSFTAVIAAYANPGNFTVTATPQSASAQSTKLINSKDSLMATNSISITANLGLVNIPSTQNKYYVLPNEQVVQGSSSSPTTVYVSVLVKDAGNGLNSFNLVDDSNHALNYKVIGNEDFSTNTVNTYAITVPAGRTIQHIQALSNVCSELNIGTNDSTACSNDADVNLAMSDVGILAIQPNYFVMSESYTDQIITVFNTGSQKISSIQLPQLESQFNITANNCPKTLNIGQSCAITLHYTANNNSGQANYMISYYNGKSEVTTAATICYLGVSGSSVGILTANPRAVFLTVESPVQLVSLTNTGNANLTLTGLPKIIAPLESSATTCLVNQVLAPHDSCTYTVQYTLANSSSSQIISFKYNNGQRIQTTYVGVSWNFNTYAYIADYTNGIQKCTVNQSNIESCSFVANTSIVSLPTYITFNKFNNTRYAYIGNSSGIYKCTLSADVYGNLSNCSLATNYGSAAAGISFATVNGNTYVYFFGASATSINNCLVNADGSISNTCYKYTNDSRGFSGFTTAIVNDVPYLYAADYSASYDTYKYSLSTTTGVAENEANLTNTSISNDLYKSWSLAVATFGGNQYAYVSGYSGSFQCLISNDGSISNNCNSVTDITPPGWGVSQLITFVNINFINFVYIADEHNIYQCAVNDVTGLFTGCIKLNASNISNPYSVAFPPQ